MAFPKNVRSVKCIPENDRESGKGSRRGPKHINERYLNSNIKDVWYVQSQPIVWFDQNFSITRENKNLKKITYIKEVKNIYFA